MNRLVGFRCSKCGRGAAGFHPPGNLPIKICGSNYVKGNPQYPLRVRRADEIVPYRCGGKMEIVCDEREK